MTTSSAPTADRGYTRFTALSLGNRRGPLSWLVDHADLFALAVLVVAAAVPAGPPTAGDLVNGTTPAFWSQRFAGANLFEILVVLVVGLWLLRSMVMKPRVSAFNRILLITSLGILCLQVIAVPMNIANADFLGLDLERILIPAAAYMLVTQSISDRRTLFVFSSFVGAAIALRFFQLLLTHGIIGTTEFGTVTGRSALLITEDVLIILFPLALLWGNLLDGRLNIWWMMATVSLLGIVVAVDFLSLRRGALLMIGAALAVRTLSIGWKRIAALVAVAAAALLLLIAAGPARSLVPDLKYAAQSVFLQSEDSSTSQRTTEFKSLKANMDEESWLTGRGLGVTWNAVVSAPIDVASYGSGESPLVRIGWHVYGLDYLYKFGLLGVLVMLVSAFFLGKRMLSAYRATDRRMKSFIYSVAVCVPPFFLLALTNQRIGLMTGLAIGLLSVACTLPARAEGTEETVRPERSPGSSPGEPAPESA